MHRNSLILILLSSTLAPVATAATFSISGASFTTGQNEMGEKLADGSIIQVGYFLGVDSRKPLSEYTSVDWDTFTALGGLGSKNSDQRAETTSFGWQASFEFDTDDPTQDLPSSFPLRLGYRIFDSADSPETANFNTVSKDLPSWVLSDPNSVPKPTNPVLNIGVADSEGFWQDAANPFSTSIAPIPEPSTFLSALLGVGLLASRRRRA